MKVRAVSHARQLLQKSEPFQKVFTVSSLTAWGKDRFVQSGFHTCSTMTRVMRVFLATAHLLRLRNEGHAFLDCILTVDESWMHSFDPQLKRQNAEWRAQTSTRKKISRLSHDAPKVMHVTSSGEMDLFLSITCQLVRRSLANVTGHSCTCEIKFSE